MDKLTQIVHDLQLKVEILLKGIIINRLTIPGDDSGSIVIKVVASDPDAVANEIWINSTTNTLNWNKGGTTKKVTLS